MNYGKVLVWTVPMRDVGAKSFAVDGSALPFIVEQLVALCAGRVLLPRESIAGEFAGTLPGTLKPFVMTPGIASIRKEKQSLFAPIAEEFGLEVDG